MTRYVLGRLAVSGLLFLAVTLLVFVAFYVLPRRESARRPTPEQYRIHGSLPVAYVHYVWRFVRHDDLGDSYVTREAVTARLFRAAPVTLSLVAGGLVVWLLLALPLGLLAALRPRSLLDRASTGLVLLGLSFHPVVLGLVLSWLFGRYLHLLPADGYCSMGNISTGCSGLSRWTSHLLLPWITFGIVNAALFTTMMRALVIEELEEDYVRTARAKGAGALRVVRGHLLKNVTAPLLTMLGLTVGTSLAGVVFVESVFDLPGLGGMLRQSATQQDLPMIAGSVLFLALAIVVLNLLVDLAYAALDPRVRLVSRV
jgi:peptide/nickel transport system permease protein